MDDFMDDDFGDIYTDVECQASYGVNSISNLDKLYIEPQEEGEEKGGECNYGNSTKQVNTRANEENPRLLISVCEKSCDSDEYVSDSEDDFDIVLNDEDCKGFSVAAERNGNRNGLKEGEDEDEDAFLCANNGFGKNGLNLSANGHRGERGKGVNEHELKQYGSLFPNNQADKSVGVASYSSKSVQGRCEDNRCNKHEVSSTGQLTSIHFSTNSVVSYGGYGFSLPWYRTILDVNIDAFEEKRWRCPGVDISDFFNFGFDEDSWKQYCISLEQLRQRMYLHNRFPNHDFSQLTQACDNRPESGRTSEGISQAGSSSKFADIREKLLALPKGRAIQVEDGTGERQSKMDVRRPRVLDSDVVIQINVQDPGEICSGSSEDKFHLIDNDGLGASTVRNLNVDDLRDVHYSDNSSADEPLGDLKSFSIKGSNKMNLDPDDPDKGHEVNTQSSEGIVEAAETVEKVEEENGKIICKPDQCLAEMEVSVGDPSHFSLTLSCSESESEESQDTVYNLPEASHRFSSRQSSGAKLLESDASDSESTKSNVAIKKQDNQQDCSRHRSPLWGGRRHQNRRLHTVSQGRIHPDIDNGASPMSRGNFSIDNCRQMKRQCDFGYHNRHNFSYDQQREFSGCYGGGKFTKIHTQDLHTRNPCLRYNHSFRNKVEAQQRRTWTEENLHERHFWLDDRDGLNEDWDSGEVVPSSRGMISLTYGKSRRLLSKYKNLKEIDIQWRRKRDRRIEFGKQTKDDIVLLDHKNEDYAMLRKYGRSALINQSFNEKFENIPSVGRESYVGGRRDRYSYRPPMGLENPRCMEIEDEHWDLDSQNLPYWCHKESYVANEGRLRNKMSLRSDIYDPRVAEIYEQHGQELVGEKYKDSDFVVNYSDYDNIEGDILYTNNQAHGEWRKYSWESRILQKVECESILRRQDNISYVKRSSGSYEKSSRHESFQSNYRSTNDCTAAGNAQLEGHRYKIFKRENNGSFPSRKPHMTCRDEHDRTAWRYSNPVDLICEEGKSSGRLPCTASLMTNREHELMEQKFVKEQKVSRNFSVTQSRRATQYSISKFDGGKDYDKPQNKFRVTERNGDFDVEEGQIVPEELIKEKNGLENKNASESVPLKQNMNKRNHCENAHTGNTVDKGYDEQRILDTLAKMERRRQRFQDPVALRKEPDSTMKPQIDLTADTVENKQERPARKRRWGRN